ncbi:type I polyketide synthase [Pseudoalteromonas sp. PPB1]|uniref:type I polyketide synthase n=1 Tax=Pseudoalteromonas sp. PPB1 TaxID=2756136 RepID=UPI0018912FE2|nr:type I polyketide synthase [Pseudoalteromonas sp. PPB1]
MTSTFKPHKTLVQLTQQYAVERNTDLAYTLLKYYSRSENRDETSISFAELDQQARCIAVYLQKHTSKGDRVVLLYRAGLEFVSAFLGCLYAGVVAVPSSVPKSGFGHERLNRILDDSGASVILTVKTISQNLSAHAIDVEKNTLLNFEDVDFSIEKQWVEPELDENDLAFIQYSSGSTGTPKGVMVSHKNLMHHSNILDSEFQLNSFVSWIPNFHDMGLIFGILKSLFGGYHGILMSPDSFVQKPLRWLQAISDFKAEGTIAPNFAYDLCVRNISDEELDSLDLSHLRYAGNAAEPVRASTIREFSEKFASCQFNSVAFQPAYGLAEATLMVTCSEMSKPTIAHYFDIDALKDNRAVICESQNENSRAIASSGKVIGDYKVKIVDADTHKQKPDLEVGEIWVGGESVAQGYWNNEEQSHEIFSASIANEDSPLEYLRTGDLGFLYQGELFVCGRLKDVILIRGGNFHACDIEDTVECAHEYISKNNTAAFSIDVEDEERLVVVSKLEKKKGTYSESEYEAIVNAIRDRIVAEHEILPYSISLMHRGIPKTTSGKIQRSICREKFLTNQFKVIHAWQANTIHNSVEQAVDQSSNAESAEETISNMEAWLIEQIAMLSGKKVEEISHSQSFSECALNTEEVKKLIRSIEVTYAYTPPPTLLSEKLTIRELSAKIEKMSGGDSAVQGLAAENLEFSLDKINQYNQNEPIAIIGMSCRFPDANTPAEYWENLCNGLESVATVPLERWDVEALYHENPLAVGKLATKRGGFLKGIDQLDRNFFNLSVREAKRMDPAHRLMMELGWETFEDAGIVPESIAESKTGVFVGISGSDYAHMQFSEQNSVDAYAGLGSALTNAASRISHFMDLRGPALAIDTACSSSLSAVHMACNSMRLGECEMALAGGVNILLSPIVTMSLSKAGMMALDGRCKAFDSSANGYVRSEGAGLVLLKPLSKAKADNDPIYAVIKGTASNQDGKSSGISAPNGEAQQRVVLSACEDAGIAPGQLNYVEAHGTGTALGDPIEVNALGEVLKIGAVEGTECAIGSVKTNIGHAESAAGIASLIKTALILKNRVIPASLNFNNPNPLIPFDELRVNVQTEIGELPEYARPALAGVNSFGVGGTNVHLVLEENNYTSHELPHAELDTTDDHKRIHVLPLSGNSLASLKANAQAMADYLLDSSAENSLDDVYHTLTENRTHFEHRLAVVGFDKNEIAEALESYSSVNHHADIVYGYMNKESSASKLAYVFSGQGSQWWAMGRTLFNKEPAYRSFIEQCDKELSKHTSWSLIEVLMADESDSKLNDTEYAQPAIFAVQVALAKLFESYGITPDAVVGHSVGEIAAAYVSESLSFEDACFLIANRARIMQKATGHGRMVSVEASVAEIEKALLPYENRVSIAAVNAPGTVVISGDTEGVDNLIDMLQSDGITVIPLPVNYAFHSPQMEPLKKELVDQLANIKPRQGKVPMVSTVTGDWVSEGMLLDANYWGDNLRDKVSFSAAIETLAKADFDLFMEVGAHPVVSGATTRTLKNVDQEGTVLNTLNKENDDQKSIYLTLSALYTKRKFNNWSVLNSKGKFLRTIPNYQWDRKAYWIDGPFQKGLFQASYHPLLTNKMPVASPTWEVLLDEQVVPFVKGPQVNGQSKLSSGILLEIALAAAYEEAGKVKMSGLSGINFHSLASLEVGESTHAYQVSILEDEKGLKKALFSYQSEASEGKSENWISSISADVTSADKRNEQPEPLNILALQETPDDLLDGSVFYNKIQEVGIEYSSALQVLDTIWIKNHSALAKIDTSASIDDMEQYLFHPLIFEAVEQTGLTCLGGRANQFEISSIGDIKLFKSLEHAEYVYSKMRESKQDKAVTVDSWILNAAGEVLAIAEGIALKQNSLASDSTSNIPTEPKNWLFDVEWQLKERESTYQSNEKESGAWLVFADEGSTGDLVRSWMQDNNQQVCMVKSGSDFGVQSENEFTIRSSSTADFEKVINDFFTAPNKNCKGIIHLWSLNAAPSEDTNIDTITEDLTCGVLSVAYAIQAISKVGIPGRPRLWLVTAGAQAAGELEHLSVAQSPLLGFAKGIAIEHPEFRCCRIDLSESSSPLEVSLLCEEIYSDNEEDQVVLRGGDRYVARLEPHKLSLQESNSNAQALPFDTKQSFNVLVSRQEGSVVTHLSESKRRTPSVGEVEIRVNKATIPAWKVLDNLKYTSELECNGELCSGEIVHLGTGVKDFAVGDKVVAVTDGKLASHSNVDVSRLAPLPNHINDKGFSSYRPFVLSMFTLKELVKLESGESVLIHGADSVYGHAAVQIAKHLGAVVYATASSKKIATVKSLGADHVFDATNPSVFEEIKHGTAGDGVHVFANCVSGFDFAKATQGVNSFGRYIDLAVNESGVEANLNNFNLSGYSSLFSCDIHHLERTHPEKVITILKDIIQLLAEEKLTASNSSISVELPELATGLMKGAGSNITVEFPVGDIAQDKQENTAFKADATYIITGGLGGLGLSIAKYMAQRGAKNIVLLGRRRPSETAMSEIAYMENLGTRCEVRAVDVSSQEQVAELLKFIRTDMPPLRGIMHAAGILDNGLLTQLDEAQIRNVMPAKIDGAWHLHTLTGEDELDFFVMFSSLASAIGSTGQSNYAAANAFLECLAAHRNYQGKAALSIGWGPWAEVGMASAAHNLENLLEHGMGMIPLIDGMNLLEDLISTQQKGIIATLPMNWSLWGKCFPHLASLPYLSDLMPEQDEGESDKHNRVVAGHLIELDSERQLELLQKTIHRVVCQTMMINPETLDMNISLTAIGLDSIVALELKHRLEVSIDAVVQTNNLLKGCSIKELSKVIRDQILNQSFDTDEQDSGDGAEGILDNIDELSVDEVESLLAEFADAEAEA